MRWRPERPWFGPSPYGKIRPVAPAGYITIIAAIALVIGLVLLRQILAPALLITLTTAILVAFLIMLAATYGPDN